MVQSKNQIYYLNQYTDVQGKYEDEDDTILFSQNYTNITFPACQEIAAIVKFLQKYNFGLIRMDARK